MIPGLYKIADVEKFLKVKAHTLRYWEEEIPIIRPQKDLFRRRVYGNREIQLFYRLKYLLYEKHFTIEGAREQLYRELTGDYQDLRAEISALRSALLDLYFMLQEEESPRPEG